MFIIYWLIQQVAATAVELRAELTIPHLITALILYKIVHKAARAGLTTHKKRKARVKKASYQNQMQKYIALHVERKHPGHPLKCKQEECQIMKIMADPQIKAIN